MVMMFLWDEDERRPRPIHWGRTMVAFAAVLLFALLAVYLVSTADFGDASKTTVPRTPARARHSASEPPPPSRANPKFGSPRND